MKQAYPSDAGAIQEQPKLWHYIIPPSILALFAIIFYYPSLHYDFQFDDLANITKFFGIRNTPFKNLFFSGTRWISTWVNTIHYKIGRFDTFSYRTFNVSIHTFSSILIFFILYLGLSGLKKKNFFTQHCFLIAFCTAGLFLLHPVQTQTVSYVIQGQLEGLACFFILAITLCFLLVTKTHNFILRIFLMTFLFALAALSTGTKEIAIVTPFLVLLFDWFFIAQGNSDALWDHRYIHGMVMLTIWGLYLYLLRPSLFGNIISLQMEARNNIGNILTANPVDKIMPLHFFISQFKVILHYMAIFIWPFNICVEYDWKLVKNFFSPDCIFPFLMLIALGYILYKILQKNPTNLFCFAMLWFFISIAPRCSIIPSSELLTDYKTYVGSVGILFILASCIIFFISWIMKSTKQIPLGISHAHAQWTGMLFILLPIGFTAYHRNTVWRSPLEFWENIIRNAPSKARAYNNYAVALSETGRIKESIPYYLKAISMDQLYPDPINNVAVAYSYIGETDKAIAAIQQAIKLQPNYPEGYNNLASFLLVKKDYDNAEKILNIALQLRPHYGKAYLNLGKLYMETGRQEKAFEAFKDCCMKGDLDNDTGFSLYASISMSLKKYDDAIFAYTKLFELKPTVETALNLGAAYYQANKINEAASVYEKILQINPHETRAIYNLGELELGRNNFAQAALHFNHAMELKFNLPQLPIRLAYCLGRLGKTQDAKILLERVATQPDMPEQFKSLAINALAQLEKPLQTMPVAQTQPTKLASKILQKSQRRKI